VTIFSVAPATIRRAEIQPLDSRDAGKNNYPASRDFVKHLLLA
jgi:hypothetical protein